VTREPDLSGQAPFAAPPAESPSASVPPPVPSAQGGAPAPASATSIAKTGGAQAE
jgi:hypothetical protein